MNTSISISLDTRRAKKDGSYPLVMRLAHNGLTIPISLGISLHSQHWDEDARVIKKSYPGSVTRLNIEIQKRKSDAIDIILKTDLKGLTIKALKAKIVAEGSLSFFDYTKELIKIMEETGKPGNARCYRGVNAVLKSFVGSSDLKFE